MEPVYHVDEANNNVACAGEGIRVREKKKITTYSFFSKKSAKNFRYFL